MRCGGNNCTNTNPQYDYECDASFYFDGAEKTRQQSEGHRISRRLAQIGGQKLGTTIPINISTGSGTAQLRITNRNRTDAAVHLL